MTFCEHFGKKKTGKSDTTMKLPKIFKVYISDSQDKTNMSFNFVSLFSLCPDSFIWTALL